MFWDCCCFYGDEGGWCHWRLSWTRTDLFVWARIWRWLCIQQYSTQSIGIHKLDPGAILMSTICESTFLTVHLFHEEEWRKCLRIHFPSNSFILARHFLEVSKHVSNLPDWLHVVMLSSGAIQNRIKLCHHFAYSSDVWGFDFIQFFPPFPRLVYCQSRLWQFGIDPLDGAVFRYFELWVVLFISTALVQFVQHSFAL